MKKHTIALFVYVCTLTSAALASGEMSYQVVLKLGQIKQPVEIEGKRMIRVYLKSKDAQIKSENIKMEITRNEKSLFSAQPTIRVISADSPDPEFPWEVFLPFDSSYADCKLIHNQPKGSLTLWFGATISGSIGVSGVDVKIENE